MGILGSMPGDVDVPLSAGVALTLDGAGSDGVHGDAVLAELASEPSGEADDAELNGSLQGAASTVGGDAGIVDDAPPATLDHAGAAPRGWRRWGRPG